MKIINIYKKARSNYFTVEKAAELLHISAPTLYKYEAGGAVVPDSTVDSMIEIYDAKWLAYEHLQKTELGQKYLPEITSINLCKKTLELQKGMSDLIKLRDEIIDISLDGIIDEDEEPRWEEISEELKGQAGVLLSLYFWQITRNKKTIRR